MIRHVRAGSAGSTTTFVMGDTGGDTAGAATAFCDLDGLDFCLLSPIEGSPGILSTLEAASCPLPSTEGVSGTLCMTVWALRSCFDMLSISWYSG